MKTEWLVVFLLIIPVMVKAQSWQLLKHVQHQDSDNFDLDQMGNIYVTGMSGTVTKYSAEGDLLLEYAPVQMARVQEIVATSQLKVTLFYEDLQEFVLLDRYLSNAIRYRLTDFDLGYVEDIAPNFQQSLWTLDISDFSLKLLHLPENRLVEQKSLSQVLNQNQAEILSFHSHQNRMYVIDRYAGVLVFDNIGNYLYQLVDKAPVEVGFEKDFLYYQEKDSLIFVHLYEGENQVLSLPSVKFSNFKYSNQRLIIKSTQGFDIYQYLSGK